MKQKGMLKRLFVAGMMATAIIGAAQMPAAEAAVYTETYGNSQVVYHKPRKPHMYEEAREANDQGFEDGYNDGKNGEIQNWSRGNNVFTSIVEQQAYVKGYNTGYEAGKRYRLSEKKLKVQIGEPLKPADKPEKEFFCW